MIFCVEDDAGIRDLMIYTLNASGFRAVGFENAKEFYTALADTVPELIMLDIMLPGEDGISILKRLKADARTADIPGARRGRSFQSSSEHSCPSS